MSLQLAECLLWHPYISRSGLSIFSIYCTQREWNLYLVSKMSIWYCWVQDYRCPDSVLVSFRTQARSDSTIWSLQTGWMRQFETEILRRKERVLFTAEICYRWDENAEKACLGYNREGCACWFSKQIASVHIILSSPLISLKCFTTKHNSAALSIDLKLLTCRK